MKTRLSPALLICLVVFALAGRALASDIPPAVSVRLLPPPAGEMRMGDVPVFTGRLTNTSDKPLQGLVVYLSLVSLKPGAEHPIDLEDWAAQKALRVDRLRPGETLSQKWSMRLIKAGRFGAALTVVAPSRNQPDISPLAVFQVAPKPTVVSARILPVAFGEPGLLLGLFGLLLFRRRWKGRS